MFLERERCSVGFCVIELIRCFVSLIFDLCLISRRKGGRENKEGEGDEMLEEEEERCFVIDSLVAEFVVVDVKWTFGWTVGWYPVDP
jgi:hypothetical protein